MNRWKIGAAAALLIGVALTVGAVLHVGADGLWRSIERIGPGGFAAYTAYNLLAFLPLGWAWWSVAPDAGPRGILVFPWGRLVRDAASDVLPFSQVGGLVAGIRALRQRGVSEPLAVASQIADLSTEMASQLVYTLFGVAVLAALLSHATAAQTLFWTTVAALAVGAVLLAAFVALQGRGLDLVGALASRWLKDMRERADATKSALRAINAQPGRLLGGFVLHGTGWVLSGSSSWLAFHFMGVQIELWKVLALESLMAAVKSVAFLTPGALGFQEGAYVLVAPMFGLTPEATLAVALLRRAKDLLVGVVGVAAWQYSEIAARPRVSEAPAPAP